MFSCRLVKIQPCSSDRESQKHSRATPSLSKSPPGAVGKSTLTHSTKSFEPLKLCLASSSLATLHTISTNVAGGGCSQWKRAVNMLHATSGGGGDGRAIAHCHRLPRRHLDVSQTIFLSRVLGTQLIMTTLLSSWP